MTLLADIKDFVTLIPNEVEQLIESVLHADWAAARPIITELVSAEEANLVANAGNPAALLTSAAAIATSALPKLVAAEISVSGVTVFNWIITVINGNPAVQTATALLATPATTSAAG